MSQADAALRNCIKFDQLEDCTLPIQAILKRCTHAQLSQIYNIPPFTNYVEFLHKVATKRGKLRPGGVPDIETAAQVVFYDWNSGKIPYYTIPPESEFAANRLDATIVSEMSKAFNLADIMDIETNTVLGELSLSSQINEFVTATSAPVPIDTEWENLTTKSMEEEKQDDADLSDEVPKPKQMKKSLGRTAIAPTKEKKEVLPTKEKIPIEQLSNPTINKERRKSLKQERKEMRTLVKEEQVPLEPQVFDNYNFDKDFWKTDE